MRIEIVNGCQVLYPENGMYLFDGEVVTNGEVWCGKHDSPDNWRELTSQELEQMQTASSQEDEPADDLEQQEVIVKTLDQI